MHISVENLGPLSKAEFDLKPLTVFIGENRRGKTKCITLATALLDDRGYFAFLIKYISETHPYSIPEIDELYTNLEDHGRVQIDIISLFEKIGQTYFNWLGDLAPEEASSILGTENETYTNLKILFTPTQEDIQSIKKELINKEFDKQYEGLGIGVVKEKENPFIHIYVTSENTTKQSKLPKRTIMRFILNNTIRLIHHANISETFYLPSERAGLLLLISRMREVNTNTDASGNNTINSENSRESNLHLPHAVIDYIGLVGSLLRTGSLEKRIREAEKDLNIKRYIEYANLLNNAIVGDTIGLSSLEPSPKREIQIKAENHIIDIQGTSSQVKGLVGLVLYLQYKARPNNLIVIDEPEQNLHPNQQVALAEFIAILVNSGLNVAITTHSPYIIEHLQNLIQAYDLKDKSDVIDKLKLKNEDALITKEKVGVYLFDNGTVENILLDDGSINWQTFCNTANDIEDVEMTIYRQKRYENSTSPASTGKVTESILSYKKE